MSKRYLPNIIITGTPGCGKTSHCENLLSQLPDFKHFAISDIAKERNCIDGFDKARNSAIVDDDKLLDSIEGDLERGGILIDWHVCDIFPERLIDLVVVLRCDNNLLYDRLKRRNYQDTKIQENLDVEIMEVIVQEAQDNYIPDIVIQLSSNNADEIDSNVDRIVNWIDNWKIDHGSGVSNELLHTESEEED